MRAREDGLRCTCKLNLSRLYIRDVCVKRTQKNLPRAGDGLELRGYRERTRMQQMLGCLHCLFALFTFPLLCDGELGHYPEQVHLQLTKQPTELLVIWMTQWCISPAIVNYSLISDRRLSSYVHGSQKSFEVGGER